MTTGNVSSAAFVINNVQTCNTNSRKTETGSQFKDVINSLNDTGSTMASAGRTRVNSDMLKDSIKSSNSVVKDDNFDVDSLVEGIKDVVKDILDISDEELEKMMAKSGLTVVDLLNPQNVVNLIAQVKNTDTVSIAVNEELSQMLADINVGINEVVNTFMKDNAVTFDEVVNLMENYTPPVTDEKQEVLQSTEENVPYVNRQDVTDESGKVIDVKINDERPIENNDNFVKNDMSSEDDHKEKNDNAGNKTNAEAVLDSLMSAVSDTTVAAGETDGINSVYVVRQIVNAVRVNITEEVRTIEVALTPEHLGRVNVTVAAKDGILTASMVVQNEMVKNAIENQLTMLKTQFESQGIKVEHVEVTVASHEFNSDMQGETDDKNNTKSGARRKFRGIDELTEDNSDIIEEQNGFTEGNINIKV